MNEWFRFLMIYFIYVVGIGFLFFCKLDLFLCLFFEDLKESNGIREYDWYVI